MHKTAVRVLLPQGAMADYMYTAAVDEASGAISEIDRRKVDGDLSPEPEPGAEEATRRLFFTRSLFRSLRAGARSSFMGVAAGGGLSFIAALQTHL